MPRVSGQCASGADAFSRDFASAAEVTEENEALIGHIYTVIAKLAKEQGFADGYRVVTNVGDLAGQTVHHIHFHVLSGKQLGSFN